MPEEIFDKIISDLKEQDYSNLLYLYCTNEPLLDRRMPRLIKKASIALPKAKIYIFSNGDLATQEIIQEYFDNGLTHFVFSIHNNIDCGVRDLSVAGGGG
jgi:MoaA/NifB/PqqE/SkfB family radical SAM enzyme